MFNVYASSSKEISFLIVSVDSSSFNLIVWILFSDLETDSYGATANCSNIRFTFIGLLMIDLSVLSL